MNPPRAFPGQNSYEPGTYEPGMSLRDWFAGQALAAIIIADGSDIPSSSPVRRAYAIANAMLAHRENGE